MPLCMCHQWAVYEHWMSVTTHGVLYLTHVILMYELNIWSADVIWNLNCVQWPTFCCTPIHSHTTHTNNFIHPRAYTYICALYTHLIYKAECVCVCLCVRNVYTRFLRHWHQTCCGCWGHWGSGYSVVDVAHLTVRREFSFHFRFFLHGRPPFPNYRSHWLLFFTRLDWLSSHGRIYT